MVEKQTGKLNDFSNKDIIYSDNKLEVYVWNKNIKKKCCDCGIPICKSSTRCSKCNGDITGGRNRKIKDEKEFIKVWMNTDYLYKDIAKIFDASFTTLDRWRKKLNLPQRRKLYGNHKVTHRKNRPKGLKYNKGDKN